MLKTESSDISEDKDLPMRVIRATDEDAPGRPIMFALSFREDLFELELVAEIDKPVTIKLTPRKML